MTIRILSSEASDGVLSAQMSYERPVAPSVERRVRSCLEDVGRQERSESRPGSIDRSSQLRSAQADDSYDHAVFVHTVRG